MIAVRFAALLILLPLAACSVRSDIKGANLQEAARINTQMGVDYYSRGDNDLALEKLKRATEQDPKLVGAHASLALVYVALGNDKLAEKSYRKALSLDSDNGDVENNFGVFLCARNRASEAERYFVAAAQSKKYATPAAAWTNAGVCFRTLDPERSERYFRAALEINPAFPDALANMAWLMYQKRDYWRARAFLQRYELASKLNAEMLGIGLQIERELGDTAAIQRYERRLRSEFPQSEQAVKLLKQ